MKAQWILGIVLALIVVFWVGTSFWISTSLSEIDNKNRKAFDELKVERDSLRRAIEESVAREQKYIIRIEADSIKALGLERSIAKRESKLKTYEQHLTEISKITISQPDSFLINRYGKKKEN